MTSRPLSYTVFTALGFYFNINNINNSYVNNSYLYLLIMDHYATIGTLFTIDTNGGVIVAINELI